ncbi:hypothetical protein B9T50_00055 [Zymomonas mobilis subsp. mobilis]|nr:hypothetical protein B9T50_00055 [Zymomonas mobilis subsp. mobilis]
MDKIFSTQKRPDIYRSDRWEAMPHFVLFCKMFYKKNIIATIFFKRPDRLPNNRFIKRKSLFPRNKAILSAMTS